jgi:hypothetical protein
VDRHPRADHRHPNRRTRRLGRDDPSLKDHRQSPQGPCYAGPHARSPGAHVLSTSRPSADAAARAGALALARSAGVRQSSDNGSVSVPSQAGALLVDVSAAITSEVGRVFATHALIATDGDWELAASVSLDASGSPAGVVPIAFRATDDLALELVFAREDTPRAFVGARFRRDPAVPGDAPSTKVKEIITAARTDRPGALRTALELLVGAVNPRVRLVELGVLNAWNRLGAIPLWPQTGRRPWPTDVAVDEIAGHTALAQPSFPAAVELVFDGPVECWIGAIVSRFDEEVGRHQIDIALVERVVRIASSS